LPRCITSSAPVSETRWLEDELCLDEINGNKNALETGEGRVKTEQYVCLPLKLCEGTIRVECFQEVKL
jgi:hypothetical protein